METTHVFKLASGVECEVRPMNGSHQRILTEQNKKSTAEKLVDIIHSCTVRVGTLSNPDKEFVKNMLSADQKKILVELRQFSLDFPKEFSFTWEYISERDGSKQKEKVDFSTEEEGAFKMIPYKFQVEEYDKISRVREITLNKSGKKVKWNYLTIAEEMRLSKLKKEQMSSHTVISAHSPLYLDKTSKGDDVWIQLDLDSLNIPDIEQLRKDIKENEGDVDTIVLFEHPEQDTKPQHQKEIRVNLLGEVAFFFPSEAI